MLNSGEFRDRFRAGTDVELFANITEMLAHGFGADVQHLAAFIVGVTLGEQAEYLSCLGLAAQIVSSNDPMMPAISSADAVPVSRAIRDSSGPRWS